MVESVYPTQTVVRETSAARVVFEETVEFESPNGWRSEVTSRLTIRRKDVRPGRTLTRSSRSPPPSRTRSSTASASTGCVCRRR